MSELNLKSDIRVYSFKTQKSFWVLFYLLIFSCYISYANNIYTIDKKIYKDVTLLKKYPNKIKIEYEFGSTYIYYKNLPNDLKEEYGYDRKKYEDFQKSSKERKKKKLQKNIKQKKSGTKRSKRKVISAANVIHVTVTGIGKTYKKAMLDAFQEAVKKAVGMYLLSETSIKNDNIDEKIYLNTDAVIIDHEILSKQIDNGIYNITISASVVKNKLAHQIKKFSSSIITSTETLNVLQTIKNLADAEKSLEIIFKDLPKRLYKAQKLGSFRVADTTNVNDKKNIKITFDWQVSFDYNEYYKFTRQLGKLLKPFAKSRSTCYSIDEKLHKWFYKSNKNRICFALRKRQKNSSIKPENIYWIDYYIPKPLLKKIKSLMHDNVVFVFHFSDATDIEIHTKYIKFEPFRSCEDGSVWSSFKYKGDNGKLQDFDTKNGFFIVPLIHKYRQIFTSKFTWESTLEFPRASFNNIRHSIITPTTGIESRFWKAYLDKDEYALAWLANGSNYIPAFEAMGEISQKPVWVMAAALTGSKRAQSKLKWKNSGLNIKIGHNATIIYTSADSGIKKGDKIVQINGKSLNRRNYEKIINSEIKDLEPDSEVIIKCESGKEVTLKVLPLEQ